MPVYWKDGDVHFVSGDVRFVPHDHGLIISEMTVGLVSSTPRPLIDGRIITGGARHGIISGIVVFPEAALLTITVTGPNQKLISYPVELSLNGGLHNNTEHIIYDVTDYLRCKHQGGNLVGTYTSPIFDIGSADRYLVYVVGQNTAKEDIVVVGAGTTWDAQVPDPYTWSDIGVGINTWTTIFALGTGPRVEMRLYYGAANPPTSYVDKMEILSAIVTARYFKVRITITDPVPEIYAYVEKYYLRYCQYGI